MTILRSKLHPDDRNGGDVETAKRNSGRSAGKKIAALQGPLHLNAVFDSIEGCAMSSLNPDREMLAQFAAPMFKHARPDGFVSLRAFPDSKSKKDKAIFVDPIRIGDRDFLEILTERARQAAAWQVPAVFCPPVATFRTPRTQRPTTFTKVSAFAWNATRARRRRARHLKPCSARLPLSLHQVANGQIPRRTRSSRNCICTGG